MTPRILWLALVLLVEGAASARAQDWLLVESITDGELWSTDSASRLLSRNEGSLAALGRVQLFAAAALRPNLHLIFMGEIEGGNAADETEYGYDQLVLRYIASPLMIVEVGKFPSPVGAFANRRLSTTNPLIGSPDGYAVSYPWGIEVRGAISRLDYRAALVTLPVTHEGYVPDPSPALRPAVGGGYTPVPQLRLGASLTWGPYLNSELGTALPAGVDWKSYSQRLVAFDSRFSIGYFEFRGELGLSRYDVPNQTTPVDGYAYYAEVKQTWSPRFFVAARAERNNYPFIRPASGSTWTALLVDVYNGEAGVGFRATPDLLLKASYRHAWSHVAPSLQASLPDGYAFAVQVSWHTDIKGWFEHKR